MSPWLAASLGLVLLASAARAETETAGPTSGGALLERLGSPVRAGALDELLGEIWKGPPEGARMLAQAVGHAGGREALRGAGILLEHGEEPVRLAALEAVARLNLHSRAVAERVRRMAREEKGEVAAAAALALGHVGEGSDMELLLQLAQAKDEDTRLAAYRAMARLTGANIPYVHARWAYYWKSFRRRATLLLPQTLVAVAIDAGGPDHAALLDLLRQYAWVDLRSVGDHLKEWLHEPDIALRSVACRLTADLRLADLGDDIEMALRFASRPELREEAERTLAILGIPPADE